MPIQRSIDADNGYTIEVWSGSISITYLKEYWTEFLSDPELLKIRRSIVDIRNAEIGFSGQELSDLIQWLVIPKLKGLSWTTAIIVAQPLQYGISRQYQVFADTYSKDAIFTDYESAAAWLSEPSNDETA